jgi:hypothetical protein
VRTRLAFDPSDVVASRQFAEAALVRRDGDRYLRRLNPTQLVDVMTARSWWEDEPS